MSADWPLQKLSDVTDFQNSKRIPLKSLDRAKRQGIYPYYGASGVVDCIDDYIFDGTFLLISEDGENLRSRNTPIAFKAHGKFWVNNHAHILSEKEEGILDYLEYYFSILDINPYITGAVQPKLNKANLDSILIPIPPKSERLNINKVLNSLTVKIELNHQTNQTLESIAQAIFKSWFVDFDPVKAKITTLETGGSQAEAEQAAMMAISAKSADDLAQMQADDPEAYQQLAETAALFPAKLVESELGLIPEGWDTSTIGEEVRVVGGGTPSTKNPDFWEGGEIHWTTPKDLSKLSNKILTDTDRKITELGLSKISSGLLPINTVLLSSRAPVGYLALAKIPVAVNQGYIAMLCEKSLTPELVIQWASANISEIKQRSSGTTFAEISKKNFKKIPVVVPPQALIVDYTKKAENIYESIHNLVIESGTLSSLRDTLLPKLLSGEIDLSQLPEPEETG